MVAKERDVEHQMGVRRIERRMSSTDPIHFGAQIVERAPQFVDGPLVLFVRPAHATHGGVVLLEQARDPLVVLLFDEESIGRSLDDHHHPGLHAKSSASLRRPTSVLASSICPARTSAMTSASVGAARRACRSNTEPSSVGGVTLRGSISELNKK